MANDKLTDRILQGDTLYWDLLGDMRGNSNHKEDICWLSGDVNLAYALQLDRFENDEPVNRLIGRIECGEVPKLLVLSPPSANADLLNRFLQTGRFRLAWTSLGMAKKLDASPKYPKPGKFLNVSRVNELLQLKACGAILNAAFEYDLFSYEHYLDAFNLPEVSFHIAEYCGLPVGACMSIAGTEIVNITWIGTLPGYRRKGIARHLIYAAEKDALRSGKSLAVLVALEGAVEAFRRIGYEGYCELPVLEFIDGK